MIRMPETVISANRKYVVFPYSRNTCRLEPKIVVVPEDQPNTGSSALWHYMNNVDAINMMENIVMTQAEFDCVKEPA